MVISISNFSVLQVWKPITSVRYPFVRENKEVDGIVEQFKLNRVLARQKAPII